MKFNEQLNTYIEMLQCTAKELSDISGLSPAVISRYRTGEREPDVASDNLTKLATVLPRLRVPANRQICPMMRYIPLYRILIIRKIRFTSNFPPITIR